MSGRTHNRDWLFRVQDMIDHVEELQKALADKNYDAFSKDSSLQRAVERYFEIIGEAARHVPKEHQGRYAHIEWSDIIGMRHKISHDYLDISTEVLWETARVKLEPLKRDLLDLLEKEDQ